MWLYDYLFYKTYLLTSRSRNFDDTPALGGGLFVIACLMFNIFAVTLMLEGFGLIEGPIFKKEYKYIFSLVLVLLIFFYYGYKSRYKRIVKKYNEKFNGKRQLHPVIVIIIYYGISLGLLLLSGMYKNHDWIFRYR